MKWKSVNLFEINLIVRRFLRFIFSVETNGLGADSIRQECFCSGSILRSVVSLTAQIKMARLWSKISAVLPPTEEQFPLQFSDKVESSVVEILKRCRQQLYSDTTSASRMLNAQIVLDFSWEKLNMGTWRHVDKEWRPVAFSTISASVVSI